jgi:hypothetical protein
MQSNIILINQHNFYLTHVFNELKTDANPNIFKAVELFQREEVDSYDKYVKAESGAKAPYRRKLNIDKDRTLQRLVV